jgi:hypothetical protein
MILVLVSTSGLAGQKKEHRHHDAHVHGAATLNIAFDQLQGKVEFKAASQGVLGFEHKAKSEKDKKKLNQMMTQFENEMGSMIQFDSSLGCVFTKEKVEMVSEKEEHDEKEKGHDKDHDKHKGEHSDFVAEHKVVCQKDIKGSKLILDFSQIKGVKDLDVTILVGDLQKTAEVKRKPVTIDLK